MVFDLSGLIERKIGDRVICPISCAWLSKIKALAFLNCAPILPMIWFKMLATVATYFKKSQGGDAGGIM